MVDEKHKSQPPKKNNINTKIIKKNIVKIILK